MKNPYEITSAHEAREHCRQMEHMKKVGEQLRDYLEEKGVECGWPIGDLDEHVLFDYPVSLIMYAVPAPLYHRVVVPGFIDFCKRFGVIYRAYRYKREDGKCTLQVTLKIKPTTSPYGGKAKP